MVGDDLVAVRDAGVAALASRRETAPAASEAELRRHQEITGRIHDDGPSLPSRFGQVFRDEAALAAALHERHGALEAALADVGDRVEMSVTIRWRLDRDHPKTTDQTSGREFLEGRAARAREHREAEQVVARLVDDLSIDRAVIRDSICPRDGVAAIVGILIARDGAEALRRRIASFEQRSSDVTAVVYGPLPPYSFAS
jgi:gas vesicle protein GvpL/GvpF